MKKFIKNIFCFVFIGLIAGEILARVFVISSDIPRRAIDRNGIQKYIPNQHGNWKGGGHSWQINELGWPGPLPSKSNNLITIIGDSYIESFMNPDSCHQSVLLKERFPNHNFIEAARSGINLIEAIKIANQLDSLKPIYHLLYIHDSDFEQSISQIKKIETISQLDTSSEQTIDGKMKSPFLKRILYNWKFAYYMYTTYLVKSNKIGHEITKKVEIKEIEQNLIHFRKLLMFIKKESPIQNKILVFRPKSHQETIDLAREMGFKTISLIEPKNSKWSFEHDPHWNCYGHEMVSKQVFENLKEFMK